LLLPIFRGMLVLAFVGFAAQARAADTPSLSAADMEAMRSALTATLSGDWSRAYAEVAATSDPLLPKMLCWMDYSRPGAPGRFPDIAEFVEKNPDWPAQKALRSHAEEALAAEPDAVAADWFRRYPPVSAAGRIREAEMKLSGGDLEGGTAALRATWTEADFGPLDEKNFLSRHSASLRPEDNVKRIDRLMWDGQGEAARRMLPLVPADY
jgi:soluble lytic murein transglycosylase